ncbi:NAD(P)/FAD-dependent oxidoreductase [Streptomyces sp. MST-110588]|uniref:FAD-dependent oxidoreductase n=1 Tax=Streptomyces sp. MST-110588 TaxID=2833628 RepID=UPI001F5D57ED|nr:NAD(P)/FAD-dependent oxidoreductase [Streptomyces sp. MST-110588]UNO40766.1 FAD-dependent monooxygenase [Streptomyces sp. MST-110588]
MNKPTRAPRVVISGAGVGGLCLAQGLRAHGIDVAVYEADRTADSRLQGYRLRIDEFGRAALAACLPERLYALLEATSNRLYMPRGVTYDEQLNELGAHRPAGTPLDPARASMVVNRRTLRQVLLTGLREVVHFGRTVVGYEAAGDTVHVRFADGASEAAEVFVIADGINSLARQQRLPHAQVLDTGLRGVYGHMALDAEALSWIPPELLGGSRPVLGPDRRTLALGVFRPRTPIPEAVRRHAPEAELDPVGDYLKWTLVAPAEGYPVPEDELFAAGPLQLHALATEMTEGWHPVLRRMVARAHRESTFALSIRAVPLPERWEPSRITLLGDCIHATTPVGGVGANTALRDAALLSSHLATAAERGTHPVAAIAAYEDAMRGYAHQAVQGSLRGAETVFRARRLAGV